MNKNPNLLSHILDKVPPSHPIAALNMSIQQLVAEGEVNIDL